MTSNLQKKLRNIAITATIPAIVLASACNPNTQTISTSEAPQQTIEIPYTVEETFDYFLLTVNKNNLLGFTNIEQKGNNPETETVFDQMTVGDVYDGARSFETYLNSIKEKPELNNLKKITENTKILREVLWEIYTQEPNTNRLNQNPELFIVNPNFSYDHNGQSYSVTVDPFDGGYFTLQDLIRLDQVIGETLENLPENTEVIY